MTSSIATVQGFVTNGGNTAIVDTINGITVYHYFNNQGLYLSSERAWYDAPDTQVLLAEDFQLPKYYHVYGEFGSIDGLVIDAIYFKDGAIVKYEATYECEPVSYWSQDPLFKTFKAYN